MNGLCELIELAGLRFSYIMAFFDLVIRIADLLNTDIAMCLPPIQPGFLSSQAAAPARQPAFPG